MEELQPKDLEELVRELEEESGAQESLPGEVEELLRVLQSGTLYLARRDAAEQLGKVGTSSPRIVHTLIAAYESDPYSMVNRAAAESLRTHVHQEYLQEHPDLMEAAERALQKRPGADRQRPPRTSPGPNSGPPLEEAMLWAGEAIDHPAGLAIFASGLILGLVRKLRNASARALQERPVADRQGPSSRPGSGPSDLEEAERKRSVVAGYLAIIVAWAAAVFIGSSVGSYTMGAGSPFWLAGNFPWVLESIAAGWRYGFCCTLPALALGLFLVWILGRAFAAGRESRSSFIVVAGFSVIVALVGGFLTGWFAVVEWYH